MMKFGRCLLFLGVTLCSNLLAEDMSGSWKVVYTGPPRTGPKTVGSILLDLKIDHGVVSGTVRIGAWPGEAPVADAKLEADHLTFTATGHLSSTTGIPTCQLDVTVRGDEMFVTLITIKNGGGPLPLGKAYEYKGVRKID
jgi:hypothetical protein